MSLERCDRGHFFDVSVHALCPRCDVLERPAHDAGPRLVKDERMLTFCAFCAMRFTGEEETGRVDGREAITCRECGKATLRPGPMDSAGVCPQCSQLFLPWNARYCPACASPLEAPSPSPWQPPAEAIPTGGTPSMPAAVGQKGWVDPAFLAPGTLLGGRYRLGGPLGRGYLGYVYRTYVAWDERLRLRVAVHEFSPVEPSFGRSDALQVQADLAGGRDRFLYDARKLARIDHPTLVRVRDILEEKGTGYLVVDYYEGESLAEHLQKQPDARLGEDVAVEIMLAVLDGLRAAHAEGVLHRDVDPYSIFVTKAGRVMLLGFGAEPGAWSSRESTIDEQHYDPPDGRWKQGPWSDVYACAATLYRMVTGRLPLNPYHLMNGKELTPAHELNSEVSPRLGEALQRGMALKPEERPQSAEEFQKLLRPETTEALR